MVDDIEGRVCRECSAERFRGEVHHFAGCSHKACDLCEGHGHVSPLGEFSEDVCPECDGKP